MRVVQLLPELNEGGVERGVVELAGKFSRQSIETVVISGGGKLVGMLEKTGAKHVKCDVFSKNLLTFLPRIFRLRKILKELSPEIVHVRSRLPAWLLKFAKIGLNFRVVSTVHGLNSPNFYSKIMIDADRIICVSNCVKEYIIKHFNAPASKISVIFRGVDLSGFDSSKLPQKSQLRSDFGYTQSDFVISCVGRISHTKNIQVLLRAMQILKQEHLNVRCIIAGGTHPKRQKYLSELLNLKAKLGLENEVNFIGSTNKVAQIYKLSDVVVSPSIKPESFGRSVAEALALNTPVVASAHGGVLDIVREGENGYFFAPTDAKELASKILLARELKFDGFAYISKNFNLDKMANETIKIYKEMV